MKYTLRSALVAIVAILAVGAVATASASAQACTKKAGSEKFTLCIAGQEIGYPTEVPAVPVVSHIKSGTVATFGGEAYGGVENIVTCKKVDGTGQFKSNAEGKISANEPYQPIGLANYELKFTSCEVLSHGCKVKEPVILKGIYGAFGAVGEVTLTVPGTNIWGNLEITEGTGGCSTFLLSPREIRGGFGGHVGPECTVTEIEVEKIEKELQCSKAKSWLNAYGNRRLQLGLEENLEVSGTYKGQKYSIYER